MAVLKDAEEKDKVEAPDTEEDEPEDKVETPEPPQDPNEPMEIVPAETQRQNAKQRRAERQSQFRQAQEERDRYRREAEDLRAREAARQQYAPPPQQQVHPAAQRLKQIDDAEKQLHDHYKAVASQPGWNQNGPEQAQFEQKARELQTARMAVIAAAQQPQINEQELIRKAQLNMYLSEHNDVWGDPKMQQWALAKWQQNIAEGQQDTREMSDRVFEETRRRFGLNPRNKSGSVPDQATRQRFSGMSSRGAGPGPSTPGAIELSAHDKKMARIAFGDRMSEKEAYQHFANTVGKKRQEQKAKGG